MLMMECPSPSPIDLRVPKSTSNSFETTLYPEVHSLVSPFYSRDSSVTPTFYNYVSRLMSPTEKYLSRNNIDIFNEINYLHSKEDNEHISRPTSSESGIDSPSTSENSPNNLEEPDLKYKLNQNESKDEKPEITGLKRRFSNGSTSSSLSNFSSDANNNGKLLNGKMSQDKKIIHFSPEKKKLRTISEDVVLPFPKKENIFLDQPEGTISFTNDIDICDSSTRSLSTRPFKAITSGLIIDPLPLKGPLGDFETFRQNILLKVNKNSKSTNHNMRRQGNATNTHITDPAYWEKRKRNNEAAKRSRDARRRKEDEVAIRCAYLEQERILIMQENKMLKEALQKYQYGFLRPIN